MRLANFSSLALLAATQFFGFALAAGTATSTVAYQTPSAQPVPNELKSQGCFSSKGNLTAVPADWMSSGKCWTVCVAKNYWVSAVQGPDCFCGFALPPQDTIAKDSYCHYACPAYPPEACGGLSRNDNSGYWSVFNTGINISATYYDPPSSSSSSSSSSTTSSSSASSQAPVVITSIASAAPTETKGASHGSSTNVAAVAAGVVSGVVAVAALIGGALLYMRRKRNAEMEEEHRRNAAVNAFISGSKPPSSSGSISMTDSRLDPVMAHRRLSDGSIADNQDYSRRILRVTNA